MTKERRAEIKDALCYTKMNWKKSVIEDLLAEVDFWKSAVKNCEPITDDGQSGFCIFCRPLGPDDPDEPGDMENHRPDCPWAIANGE